MLLRSAPEAEDRVLFRYRRHGTWSIPAFKALWEGSFRGMRLCAEMVRFLVAAETRYAYLQGGKSRPATKSATLGEQLRGNG